MSDFLDILPDSAMGNQLDSTWNIFYNNIRGNDWPDCNEFNKASALPEPILLEIIQKLLVNKDTENIKLNFTGNEYPEFLWHINKIFNLLGKPNCMLPMSDVLFLYSTVFSRKPKTILEVGRLYGFSTLIIAGASIDTGSNFELISIDIEDRLLDSVKKTLLDHNTILINESCEFILDNPIVNKKKIDLFFIDPNYDDLAYKRDFPKYIQLASDNCYFLFHNMHKPKIKNALLDVLKENKDFRYLGLFSEGIGLVTNEKI